MGRSSSSSSSTSSSSSHRDDKTAKSPSSGNANANNAITNEAFLEILDEHIANKNTRDQYKRRLKLLVGVLNTWQDTLPESKRKNASTIVLWCLLHPRKCFGVIKEAYPNVQTAGNMLTFVLSLFKYAELKCRYEAPYKKWLKYHGKLGDQIEDKYKTNEPTLAQREKYISFDDMASVISALAKSKDPHKTLELSMEYSLISMYAEITPLRSDFGRIRVYARDKERKDRNYVVVGAEGGEGGEGGEDADKYYFVINHYNKTQMGKDGTMKPSKHIPITARLAGVFRESLQRWPRKYLFMSRRGNVLEKPAAYSKFVTSTYKKHFGKAVGTSMLRHIYVTEKVNANNQSVADRERIAESMGHSRHMQDLYKLFVTPPDASKRQADA